MNSNKDIVTRLSFLVLHGCLSISALVEFGIDYEEEKAKVRDFGNLRLMVDDDLEAVIASLCA